MADAGPSTSAPLLKTDAATRKLWLVKVPNFVAEHWHAACDKATNEEAEGPGPALGVIKYSTNDKGQAVFDLTLDSQVTAGIPQEYRLNVMTDGMADMLAFSNAAGSTAAEGRINQKFDLEPALRPATMDARGAVRIDPAYRQLSRQRQAVAAKKTRTVQFISQEETAKIRQPVVLAQLKRKAPVDKRVALAPEDLLPELFRLFERQARWSFVELQRATGQPTQHLKAVLADIAVQSKHGPYKDFWELKKGYAVAAAGAPS